MSYNPLAAECKAQRAKIARMTAEYKSVQEDIEWHAQFIPERARRSLRREAEKIASLEKDRQDLKERIANSKLEQQDADNRAKLGWNPAGWMSPGRREAKTLSKKARRTVEYREGELAKLERSLRSHNKKRRVAVAEIARHEGIDPPSLKRLLREIGANLTLEEISLEDLEQRRKRVDDLLKEPLGVLEGLEAAAVQVRGDLAAAQLLESQLTAAANSYERKMLHEQCSQWFTEGSPRAVISAKNRKLRSLERDIIKTQSRLDQIGRQASRDVRAVVVDGSNLCFEGSTFIGLSALRPLVVRLADTRAVTVVFDASIRRRLSASDEDLRARLPGATVHVVAHRRKADETILDSAADPRVFVISNDRFSEFADKLAVKDDRIIRHEIINGRVLVHDLAISESFVTPG
ncbi:hypothetical protein [Barrientosiimonas humi]|uniref:hypothetical protein n=1 Tax=Barrientosiimonas humi TaxID=999931 RepID=UPI00370D2D70